MSKKKVEGFFAYLVVVVVDSINQPYFYFIEMFVIDLAIGLGRADCLAIGGAVLTEIDITIDFSELFLW